MLLARLELQLGEPRVKSAGCGELLMRALFDNASFIHHNYAVTGQYRREPVRDDQRGALFHQALKRRLHQFLTFGIERGRRFVKQEKRRIAQDGASNRDTLTLSA
jgi:hypothetical protein